MPRETRPPEGEVEIAVHKDEMNIQEMQEFANHLIKEAPHAMQKAEQFLNENCKNFDPHAEPAKSIIKSLEDYFKEVLQRCTNAIDLLDGYQGDAINARDTIKQLETIRQNLQETPSYKRLKALLYLLKGNLQPGEWLYTHQPKSKNNIAYEIKSVEGAMLRAHRTDTINDPHDELPSRPLNGIVILSIAKLRENHKLLYAVKTLADIEADIAAHASRRPRTS